MSEAGPFLWVNEPVDFVTGRKPTPYTREKLDEIFPSGDGSIVRALLDKYDALAAENAGLTRQVRVLTAKASGSLANNLCPDHRDKQTRKPCLACEIERLQRRLADAISDAEIARGET